VPYVFQALLVVASNAVYFKGSTSFSSPTPLGRRVDFPFGIGLTMVAYGGRLSALKGLYHLPQAPIGGGLTLFLGVGLAPFCLPCRPDVSFNGGSRLSARMGGQGKDFRRLML